MQPVERVPEIPTVPHGSEVRAEVASLVAAKAAGASRTSAGSRLAHLWALLYFSLLSVVMTWPLVLRMGQAVVGEIGDNIYFVFLIRWYQKAWFELGISPFFHPWLNYPQGWNLASTDTALSTTLPGLLFSLFGGPVFGYNMAMLLTFVLSGWAMFYWVRRLTGSTAAGLLAGTIYAFLPYRMAHYLAGHLNLAGTQWFPLYFMGLYDLLRSSGAHRAKGARAWLQQIDWKTVVLTALMLGLIGFTSMYYLYMTLLISAGFVAAMLLVDWPRLRERACWQALGLRLSALGLASLPLVTLAILPFLNLSSQGGLAERSADYASMYSASPTDFLLPSTDHFLWGPWVGAHFDRSLWIESTFYIGAVALVLAAVAWWQRGSTGLSALIKIALLVSAAAFVLALGTELHWNNQGLGLPMPALLLFRFLPFYAKMRALLRIGFFVLIFSSLLAGIGAAWLFQRVGPRRALPLAALLIGLVLFDFYPGPALRFSEVAARPVDAWLAQQPGQGAVAQFPFSQAEDQDQVYNTLVHQKPYIGGFFSANQPEQYLRIRPELAKFPTIEGVMLLKELEVQWVLLDTRAVEDIAGMRSQLEAFGLRYVDTIGDQAVFELGK